MVSKESKIKPKKIVKNPTVNILLMNRIQRKYGSTAIKSVIKKLQIAISIEIY